MIKGGCYFTSKGLETWNKGGRKEVIQLSTWGNDFPKETTANSKAFGKPCLEFLRRNKDIVAEAVGEVSMERNWSEI